VSLFPSVPSLPQLCILRFLISFCSVYSLSYPCSSSLNPFSFFLFSVIFISSFPASINVFLLLPISSLFPISSLSFHIRPLLLPSSFSFSFLSFIYSAACIYSFECSFSSSPPLSTLFVSLFPLHFLFRALAYKASENYNQCHADNICHKNKVTSNPSIMRTEIQIKLKLEN
jgi:hypothetical protein